MPSALKGLPRRSSPQLQPGLCSAPWWKWGLTIILATTAMLWNIIYNFGFDRFWPVQRVKRTAKVRALHALGFECGFIVIGVSIVAAVLGVTLLQAFTLEIGFFLFFLPYTMFYNWAYDTLREKFLKRRQQRRALAG